MASTASDKRSQVMVGPLPNDFLRIGANPQLQQIAADEQAAQMLQAQQSGIPFAGQNMARLTVTLTQAKLTKNYGVMKMDPYCRVRVGHSVFETHTAHNGGKNPRWNKSLHCFLPQGVDSIYVEIFDEKAFTMDNRIGWTHINIPEQLLRGETVDEWYTLNGKQGEGKEGMLNLVLSYSVAAPRPAVQPLVYASPMQPVVMVPAAMPVYYPPHAGGTNVTVSPPVPQMVAPQLQQQMVPQPQQQMVPQPQQGPLFTDDDVKQVKDMFPHVDEEVIKSVLEANRGNKERTINNLLSMNS